MCAQTAKQSITIKKYANRRLYNTATSSYVTLEDLSEMVKVGSEFNVYDAKTSEDITRSVLTQIIVEEESKEDQQNLLPVSFLRQLIGFYGDNLQWMVPKYLEHSMEMLSGNQDQIRDYFQTTLGTMFPFGSTLEEMSKQNMSMFENALRMFSPMTSLDALTGSMTTSTKPAASSNAKTSCCTQASDSNVNAKSDSVTSKACDSATACSSAKTPAKTKPNSNECCSINDDKKNSKIEAAATKSDETTANVAAPAQTASITNLKPRTAAMAATSTTNTAAPSTVPEATVASTSTPMPNVQNVTATTSGADDMQQKIANLQRQLADLAKSRA